MEGFIPFMDDFFSPTMTSSTWRTLTVIVMVSLLKNQICNTEFVICLKRMLHHWLAKDSQSHLASVQLSMHCPILLLKFFFLVNQSWKNGWLLWLCITFLYQIKRSMLHIFLSRQNLGHISPWTYSSFMPLPSVILYWKKVLK